MVGGGNRRDDGLPAISSTNIFSALESRRRKSNKKKSEKERSDSGSKEAQEHKETLSAPQVWTPTPVSVTSWADCEDDDDYFATAAPPPVWPSDQPSDTADHSREGLSQGEESEGDEEGEDEAEDEVEDELENELPSLTADVLSSKPPPTPGATSREPDRQLSKKELKKKELAELEAVLVELGLNQKDENESPHLTEEIKQEDVVDEGNSELENREGRPVLTESKSSKRRKAKREKSFKEGRDEEVPPTPDAEAGAKDEVIRDEAEVNSGPADPKEVLKRLASLKKKKSSKENDAAAKAAAAEAAARAAKLAAAKKKEKNHYNQQPVR